MSDQTFPQYSEFEPEGPFKEKYKFGIRRQQEFKSTTFIALYVDMNDFPIVMDEKRYQECIKAGKILTPAEYHSIMEKEGIELSSMQTILKVDKEPKPPINHIRFAGHHWLDDYDSDGHFFERVVLQWNPGAQRWSHSGMVGTGSYVNTSYWRYVGPCPIPE